MRALRLILLPGLAVVALLIAWRLGYFDLARREQLVALIGEARHTSWAGLLYVVAYTLVAALGLPVTVLSIVGGAVFGVVRGTILAWSGRWLAL
jgi:uncharacterized membrane protein YdjX (TVP38/TMEM64 family)